jgi:hypothetical protein
METLLDPVVDNPSLAGSPKRRRNFRILGCVALVIAVFVALIGILVPASPEPEPPPQAAPDPKSVLQQQLDAIIAGESTQFYIADFPVDDELLARVPWEQMTGLQTVLLDEGIVDDAGLAKFASLPAMEHIRLRHSPITDQGADSLSNSSTLMVVNLPHSELTLEGIRKLAKMPRLRQLRLGSPRLTNEACSAIQQIRSLRGLHLIGVPISDEGLKILAELPNLESLYLDDSAVTEVGWQWLFRNHPQLHVHVNQRHHDRDPKSHKHHD